MNETKEITRIEAFFLPAGMSFETTTSTRILTSEGPVELLIPVLDGEKLKMIIANLSRNRSDYLSTLSTSEIIERIAVASEKWLNPSYPQRVLAEQLLPALTGYAADSIRLQLKRYMRTFRRKELLRFIGEEFDDPLVLDEFRPRKSGGFSRAYGPKLLFQVFSGNVPGVSLWSMTMGLLLRSAQLGKTSMAEPLMAVWFAQSLAEVDAKLADSIAILPWKGGSEELEREAIRQADTVTVYGGRLAVESVRAKVPIEKKFVAYGPKASFAMIGKEALTPDRMNVTISRLAADVAHYDQQSCMSPQCVYIEDGGSIDAQGFAALIAAELGRLQLRWPRASLADQEAYAILEVRNRYWLEEAAGEGSAVYASTKDAQWTVVYHNTPRFEGSPLNRTLHVYRCRRVEDVIPMLEPAGQAGLLQTCGAAIGPHRMFALAEALGNIGVNRFCHIGSMLQAKAGWHHDGRFNLMDLIRFTDIERTMEDELEQYDPDFE